MIYRMLGKRGRNAREGRRYHIHESFVSYDFTVLCNWSVDVSVCRRERGGGEREEKERGERAREQASKRASKQASERASERGRDFMWT